MAPPRRTTLYVYLPGRPPDVDTVIERFAGSRWRPTSEDRDDGWRVRLADPVVRLWLKRPPELDGLDLHTSGLDAAERAALRSATYTLVIETILPATDPAYAFGELVRIALCVAPDAVALVDPGSHQVHGAAWLEAVATTGVPIPLDAIYTVHAVSDGDVLWLHSHGLERCGLVELELHDVARPQLPEATALLRAVAHRCLVHGVPDLGAPLPYGRSLSCALVPTTYVLPHIQPCVGGIADRDDDHPMSTLALVTWEPTAPDRGVWRTAAEALIDRGTSPVFFLTEYETERMEALARLRWQGFAFLANHFSGAEGWRFLAKFGYGGERDGSRREHLWFEVHGADPLRADATLVNRPFQDLGMREGERGKHHIERLTDFRVSSPVGVATPESLDRMLREWMSVAAHESAN